LLICRSTTTNLYEPGKRGMLQSPFEALLEMTLLCGGARRAAAAAQEPPGEHQWKVRHGDGTAATGGVQL
jgi:hypothetical protein